MSLDRNERALQEALEALMANDLDAHMRLVAPGVRLTMACRTLAESNQEYETWLTVFLADRAFGEQIQIVAATSTAPGEELYLVVAFHAPAIDGNPVGLTSTFTLRDGLINSADLQLPGTPGRTWQMP